jgi:hypothetical protein
VQGEEHRARRTAGLVVVEAGAVCDPPHELVGVELQRLGLGGDGGERGLELPRELGRCVGGLLRADSLGERREHRARGLLGVAVGQGTALGDSRDEVLVAHLGRV